MHYMCMTTRNSNDLDNAILAALTTERPEAATFGYSHVGMPHSCAAVQGLLSRAGVAATAAQVRGAMRRLVRTGAAAETTAVYRNRPVFAIVVAS